MRTSVLFTFSQRNNTSDGIDSVCKTHLMEYVFYFVNKRD